MFKWETSCFHKKLNQNRSWAKRLFLSLSLKGLALLTEGGFHPLFLFHMLEATDDWFLLLLFGKYGQNRYYTPTRQDQTSEMILNFDLSGNKWSKISCWSCTCLWIFPIEPSWYRIFNTDANTNALILIFGYSKTWYSNTDQWFFFISDTWNIKRVP